MSPLSVYKESEKEKAVSYHENSVRGGCKKQCCCANCGCAVLRCYNASQRFIIKKADYHLIFK